MADGRTGTVSSLKKLGSFADNSKLETLFHFR